MEDNEKEVVETEVEETESTNVEEETNDNTPTLEDYEKLKKERETLLAQKEHWKKKAQSTPLNKTDITQTNKNESLSEDDVISLAGIVASGVKTEVIKEAKELAKLKGITIAEALELPTIKAYANELKDKERKDKAQLSPSNGSTIYQDFRKPLTPEEHKKLWEKTQK